MSKAYNFLIKPASSLCNLDCDYCFYKDIANHQNGKKRQIMDSKVMERLIDEALVLSDGEPITFGFQGGEPLLAPISYYEEFTTYVFQRNKRHSDICYTIQTNGSLLTEKHISFFKQNKFLIGLSLDGDRTMHDFHRKAISGESSYNQGIRALKLLQEFDVPYNVLTVITHQSAPHIEEIYHHFRSLQIEYMQFIPVIEPLYSQLFSMPYALTQKDYSSFHKTLWKLYTNDRANGHSVHIRYFDNLLSKMKGHSIEQCGLSGLCYDNLVIEADGTVYPCDFYSIQTYSLGNIMFQSLNDMVRSETMKFFLLQSLKTNSSCCTCELFWLCSGGCRRYHENPLESPSKHRYCEGIKDFLRFVLSTNS